MDIGERAGGQQVVMENLNVAAERDGEKGRSDEALVAQQQPVVVRDEALVRLRGVTQPNPDPLPFFHKWIAADRHCGGGAGLRWHMRASTIPPIAAAMIPALNIIADLLAVRSDRKSTRLNSRHQCASR